MLSWGLIIAQVGDLHGWTGWRECWVGIWWGGSALPSTTGVPLQNLIDRLSPSGPASPPACPCDLASLASLFASKGDGFGFSRKSSGWSYRVVALLVRDGFVEVEGVGWLFGWFRPRTSPGDHKGSPLRVSPSLREGDGHFASTFFSSVVLR